MALNGCRLGFYEPLRTSMNSLVLTHSPLNSKDSKVVQFQSLPVNIIAGATSGILGAVVGSPFFLVKTRLQSYSPFLPVGTQHQYKNAWDGLSQIYKAEGVRGLYRGVVPAMVRTGFGSSVQLPTYFFAKRRLVKHFDMKEGPALHLLSSTASGFVVCVVMHPPDTVMSRMYNQTGNLYNNAFECLYKTVKTEGIFAVYKGFFAHLARILPHTVRPTSVMLLNLLIHTDPDSFPGRANEQAHEKVRRSPSIAMRSTRCCTGIQWQHDHAVAAQRPRRRTMPGNMPSRPR